jgi:excisionase family DNA binding protein
VPSVIEPHYTAQQLAKLFALNAETIRREAARGNLRFIRIGKDLRFAESAVKEWCESKKDRAA